MLVNVWHCMEKGIHVNYICNIWAPSVEIYIFPPSAQLNLFGRKDLVCSEKQLWNELGPSSERTIRNGRFNNPLTCWYWVVAKLMEEEVSRVRDVVIFLHIHTFWLNSSPHTFFAKVSSVRDVVIFFHIHNFWHNFSPHKSVLCQRCGNCSPHTQLLAQLSNVPKVYNRKFPVIFLT